MYVPQNIVLESVVMLVFETPVPDEFTVSERIL